MAMTIYAKFDGLDGQTTTKGFEKQIELLAISHGVSMNVTSNTQSNQTRTEGKPSHQDVNITKALDDSSAEFLQYCCSGKDFKSVVITIGQMDDAKMVPLWVVTLTSAIVSSVSMGSGGDIPVETISLNYTKIKWEFKKQTASGEKSGTKSAEWDLTTVTPK